jgi:hypothetical protein
MLEDYNCILCNFKCSKLSNYNNHLLTKKHKKNILAVKTNIEVASHECICNRKYIHMSSLYKHRQKCKYYENFIKNINNINTLNEQKMSEPLEINENPEKKCDRTSSIIIDNQKFSKDIIVELIEQNNELRNLLLEERELIKSKIIEEYEERKERKEEREEILSFLQEQSIKIEQLAKQNTIINNNTNNFNLNIFLNEKCKNAITLLDFIETLQIDTTNVEYTGKFGYVEGITKIFIDGLKQLDIYKRPIHCTDLKRETLYIKEESSWEKDNQEKSKFKKALGKIVRKNMQLIQKWQEINPRCDIINSPEFELHLNIMKQSIGGGSFEKTERNNEKIIRNIVKHVLIDKTKTQI